MIHIKVLSVAVLAAMVSCEPPVGYNYQPPRNNYQTNHYNAPSNSYIPPNTGFSAPSNNYLPPSSFGSGSDSYDHGHGNSHGHNHDNEIPKSYEFGYSVKDAQSGNDYDRRETSDGNVVRGEYRVQLPDGRTQIVTYHADWKTGFHADVRYEGEARYPEPSHNTQGYNYNAPNDFSGSLTGFHNGNSGYKPSTAYGPPGYH
ncbi:pro-resilin-like [Galleria mellonella]|uniref:Pro-resilin-like n=1 Tax=Galleria mellonella TaxID=7137 RepID=A0ABM3M947_GALME|nr:pro-resilin-like [Galleria mellonella]